MAVRNYNASAFLMNQLKREAMQVITFFHIFYVAFNFPKVCGLSYLFVCV